MTGYVFVVTVYHTTQADRHKKWIVHQQERNDAAALVGITHTFDMDAHSVEVSVVLHDSLTLADSAT